MVRNFPSSGSYSLCVQRKQERESTESIHLTFFFFLKPISVRFCQLQLEESYRDDHSVCIYKQCCLGALYVVNDPAIMLLSLCIFCLCDRCLLARLEVL